MFLPLNLIRTDGGTQPREAINHDVVEEYRAEMVKGTKFPDIVVFYDGSAYWLADGFHRVLAAKQARKQSLNADVRQGARRDAVLHSVGANAAHGLRRTNADKRRAVTRLLEDEEWGKWSDREIARRCGVSNVFVSKLSPSLLTVNSEKTYTTKHGIVATMNTANIGRSRTALQSATPFVAVATPPPPPPPSITAIGTPDAEPEEEGPLTPDEIEEIEGDIFPLIRVYDRDPKTGEVTPLGKMKEAWNESGRVYRWHFRRWLETQV